MLWRKGGLAVEQPVEGVELGSAPIKFDVVRINERDRQTPRLRRCGRRRQPGLRLVQEYLVIQEACPRVAQRTL